MALSAIALCSRALLKIGANTIASFDEGTAEAEVAGNLYPQVRDALLSSHPWSFATDQSTLAKLSAAPIADYQCAFQLPSDFLRALSAGADRGRGLDYRIAQKRLHANVDQVVLTYIFRPAEEDFPPYFDALLISQLAAEFCGPITESTTRAELLFKLAEDGFRRAKLIDGQQAPPRSIQNFPLIDVRG